MTQYQTTALLTDVSQLLPLIIRTVQEVMREEMQKPNKTDELMNTAQIAEYLKVSDQTIWNWVKANKIPYLKINRRYWFKLDEVIKAIEQSNQLLMG